MGGRDCLYFGCIWRERNQWKFEGKELSVLNLKFLFLKTLYELLSPSFTLSGSSLMEFLDSLNLSH